MATALPSRQARIPLVIKLAYTAFCLVLIPVYWTAYGPTNFLYFCDIAAFFTLAAVWTEMPLLASMPAVGILMPQLLWVVDLLFTLCGSRLTGMTGYMFNPKLPLLTRLLSLFHGWLPFLLVYLVYRLGYDRRALPAWTVLAWLLLAISYLLLPVPPAPADNPNLPVNVDYVYGLSDDKPQEMMSQRQWLTLLVVGLPLLLFLPAALVLDWMPKWRPAERDGSPPVVAGQSGEPEKQGLS